MKTENIFRLSPTKLKKTLRSEMVKLGYKESILHNKADFLYAEGNAPYMLVAHLDTVHTNLPSIICYSKDGDYMMSPQGIGGDDRCGVYIILELLAKLPFKPYVLFTMDEEIGGLGASAFVDYMISHDIPELKYIIEYDRKGGEDCVFYRCDNLDFVDFVEGFGFKEAYGTFTDISIIAPEFGVAAVNLSSGYYNPHTEHEYVSFNDMHRIIEQSLKMLQTECQAFEYKEIAKSHSYSNYYDKYGDVDMYVSYIPENTLWVHDANLGEWRENKLGEIVVDEDGNLYKYSESFGDYIGTTAYPIESGFIPEYDESQVTVVQVFTGYY